MSILARRSDPAMLPPGPGLSGQPHSGGRARFRLQERISPSETVARSHALVIGLVLAASLLVLPAWGQSGSTDAALLASQAAEYDAETAKTIVELQQYRHTEVIGAEGAGGRRGKATLINLNPRINAWFLLMLDWGEAIEPQFYHLENPDPRGQEIRLSASEPHGVQILSGDRSASCSLWFGGNGDPLEAARRSAVAYAPLCGNRLYLRNHVAGRATALERTTDFLRDYVWGGEEIVGFIKKEFYSDEFMDRGQPAGAAATGEGASDPLWPLPASLDPAPPDRGVAPAQLGIELGQPAGALAAGRWYPVRGLGGVYASFLQPQMIAPSVLVSYGDRVNSLDDVENAALVYLVAFDLRDFDLGFALGTDHPRLGWSARPPDTVRNELPGPDGIDTPAPLVTNGLVSPTLVGRTIATFTGGFKRQHGAFRYGPLAQLNHGSHYGFVEQGTVFSKLQPGLSTLYVLDDGTVGMKTWAEADKALLSRVKDARQNGVPLIEPDPSSNDPAPGRLVARWGPGNWSGSADEKLRTLRAGACLQETPTRRFLIYGYFSTATPSAMARVFQAYGCRYAMHLDMNALEHTYLALYLQSSAQFKIEYLIQGMAEVDSKAGPNSLGRFLGYPDDRDFFYLYRKAKAP
jgi:hypothetical protein